MQAKLLVYAVELTFINLSIGYGGGLPPSFCPHEQIAFASRCDGPDGAFGGANVQLQEAVIEVGPRLGQAGQCISDGLGQWRRAGELTQLRPVPYLQIIKDGLGVLLL